jgi:hypothetical protein
MQWQWDAAVPMVLLIHRRRRTSWSLWLHRWLSSPMQWGQLRLANMMMMMAMVMVMAKKKKRKKKKLAAEGHKHKQEEAEGEARG